MRKNSIFAISLSLFALTACDELSKSDREAYNILIHSGNRFIDMNEPDYAMKDFKNALQIHPTGKEAHEGVYKVFQHNCDNSGRDCKKAAHLADSLGLEIN